MLTRIDGGITAVPGIEAASCAAGIKYEGRTDMALVFSKAPCTAAGTFTSNVVKAAPVQWDRRIVAEDQPVHAVVVNTGIANAGTGAEGMRICEVTARAAAEALGIPERSVLIGSTGVIGMQISEEKILAGVKLLAASKQHSKEAGTAASKAIMTTDTVNKEVAFTFTIPDAGSDSGIVCTIGGMAKGSGMIHPNMCTMLSYIATDVSIRKDLLQKMLSEIVKDTFNMISVDGDTSTNDTLIVMANGLAGNEEIAEEGPAYEAVKEALQAVCLDLCRRMAADGEGATRLIECRVEEADTRENARILAKSVICSNLTKAAVFGKDANWGRILCALGYSGVSFDPEKVDLYLGPILLYTNGAGTDFSEEEATKILSEDEVILRAVMHQGDSEAIAWGCDLTYDYVSINADYRS